MVFLGQLTKVTDTKCLIGFKHYQPFHEKHGLGKTQEELEQEGILVESIPEPQQIKGKSAVLYCNPATKELWHEYEDIPKTKEQLQAEEITNLKTQLQATQEAVDFLIMGGM